MNVDDVIDDLLAVGCGDEELQLRDKFGKKFKINAVSYFDNDVVLVIEEDED